ncbi:hypothetical protein QR680_017997 [Steinernema hermaphroditum]|uniref:Saposin B-type domain-containing protein n=1 Tax=Steinernema hermaphroditum TaxID=289476 RepID=A0AA39LQE1_9BILA|nr:hypothetical protein QR680_017997 [Steinernema hermaphroditum]
MKLLPTLFLVCGLIAVSQSKLLCGVCEDLVGGIEADIEGDETSIIDKANKVCDKLTNQNFLDGICKSLIDNGIVVVEDDIRNKEDPSKVCKKMHAC